MVFVLVGVVDGLIIVKNAPKTINRYYEMRGISDNRFIFDNSIECTFAK